LSIKIIDHDLGDALAAQISNAAEQRQALSICAGNSKAHMGYPVNASILDVAAHTGIISYQPDELVVTVRAGTRLADLQQLLAEQRQKLPFEPPLYDGRATIGGTVACNASGPARPYLGAVRDFVLGVHMINGQGQTCHFGGEVMKNVAGYDVARLMAGAMGTLGVLLDISIKVLPLTRHEQTRVLEMTNADSALHWLSQHSGNWPLTAACYTDRHLYLRLSGNASAVTQAGEQTGGEILPPSTSFWESLREQQLPFFDDPRPLWRLSVAPMTPCMDGTENDTLFDWAGAQRWLLSEAPGKEIRAWVSQHGGHASCLRNRPAEVPMHQPLAPALATLHRSLQQSFDPYHILNPGRLYPTTENS